MGGLLFNSTSFQMDPELHRAHIDCDRHGRSALTDPEPSKANPINHRLCSAFSSSSDASGHR